MNLDMATKSETNVSFRLAIVEGKGQGKEFYFSKTIMKVGRAPENDLVLYDMGVSRFHAEISWQSETFVIRDMGSANGTLVNGLPSNEAPLKQGDRLQIGPVVFEFHPHSNPITAPEPAGIQERRSMFRPADDQQRALFELGRTTAMRREDFHYDSQEQQTDPRAGANLHVLPSSARWYEWSRLPKSTRRTIFFATGILLLGVCTASWLMWTKQRRDRSRDIFPADATHSAMSFGSGKQDVFTPDHVQFRFNYEGGRVTVSYAIGGIDSANELEILVNGEHIAFTDPSPGSWTLGLSANIPRRVLKPGANILTFDNTRTPAQDKKWGVMHIRVKQEPLPPPNPKKAEELFDLGQAAFDAKGVAPPNLYRAIQYFQEARLYLEGMDNPPKLLEEITASEEKASEELNRVYNSYLFTAEKALRFGDHEEALTSLRDLLRYLPDTEDARHQKVKKRLIELSGTLEP